MRIRLQHIPVLPLLLAGSFLLSYDKDLTSSEDREDGMAKAEAGLTSMEEVFRETA